MLQNVLGSDGQMHVENQVGNMRIDLTTAENMAAVIGKDGVETEIQVGQMC